MGELRILLRGRIPSKKNSKQIVGGSRPFLIPSKNYKIWHEEKMWELKAYRVKTPISKCSIDIDIMFPDHRKADLTNKAESINDLLVDAGILEDDDHKILNKVNLTSLGVDKNNPRAVIVIKYEDNNTTTSKTS